MLICQLCGLEKNLIKAHIIPRKLYEPIKELSVGEKQGDKAPRVYTLDKEQTSRQVQSGIYDNSILCKCCDGNIIGPWDTYGQNFLLNPSILSETCLVRKSGIPAYYDVKTFDYLKLKLFFMSILLRAEITKDPFFAQVTLGSWRERLKTMVLEHNPGSKNEFSVILFKYIGELSEIIQNPTRERYSGINYYRFRFPNFGFLIKIDNRSFPSQFDDFILNPDRSFLIRCQEYKDSKELHQILESWNNITT